MAFKKADGKYPKVTAPSALSSGDPFAIEDTVFIAQTDAASGEPVAGARVAAWEVPKASSQSWTRWETIYYDDSEDEFTTTATDNIEAGVAWANAASADTTGQVLLSQ